MNTGKEFKKVPECQEYCKNNNLSFFKRDLSARYQKICEANTFDNIFTKIINGKNNYYESWHPDQNMKLYIDYDKKEKNDTESEITSDLSHKNDIYNIISEIRSIIPEITNVYLLKSIPDVTKKSYHIIFDGVFFEQNRIMKEFIQDKLEPRFGKLFKDKIIDTVVYGKGCFRSLLCTKFGQDRKLKLLKLEPFMTEMREEVDNNITVETFKKTCITYIESCIKYNYVKVNRQDASEVNEQGDIYTDKEIVKKYLDILDADRYTNYDKWLKIGFILHSINIDNKDLWHYFSAKWEGYSRDNTEQKWMSFSSNTYVYTIYNLMHLARLDNITEYNEINDDIPDNDIRYLRNHDNILSKFIHRLYGERFVCSNPEKKEWYFFNGIRWVLDNKNYTLRKLISTEVYNKIDKHIRTLVDEKASENVIKIYRGILSRIGNGKEFNHLEINFFNSNFHKIINQNKYLIGFENGVYDLKTFQFRKGIPSDYITMSTGYNYISYDSDSEMYKTLIILLYQILPIPSVRTFTLKSLATTLDGCVLEQNFYIWSGKNNSGANGKSTIMDLMEQCLGDYACTVPVALFTSKRESSNNANSALMSILGKRLAITAEPEANDIIQVGNMKSLTGCDTISTRELNSRQISFKPECRFFLLCNQIPNLSGSDGGTERRIKVTEFVSKFVTQDKFDASRENEFLRDESIKTKIPIYKECFMCIMIEYYKIYKSEGLIPPSEVDKVTQRYTDDNNHIKMYIKENLTTTTNIDNYISKNDLKEAFKLSKIDLY